MIQNMPTGDYNTLRDRHMALLLGDQPDEEKHYPGELAMAELEEMTREAWLVYMVLPSSSWRRKSAMLDFLINILREECFVCGLLPRIARRGRYDA